VAAALKRGVSRADRLRAMCRRFDVKGVRPPRQQPFAAAAVHSALSRTSGLLIS